MCRVKTFLKEHKGILIGSALVVLFGSLWLLLWHRISQNVQQAEYNEAFQSLIYDEAYYTLCDAKTASLYLGEVQQIDRSLCGQQLATLSIPTAGGTVSCPLYACKALESAGKENAIVLLERGSGLSAYELTGFRYLDTHQSIYAVCASYGIGTGSDLASVSVYDNDGTLLSEYTSEADLNKFFENFTKLGENLTDEQTAQIYRDTYIAEYGDDGKVSIAEGKVTVSDQEAHDKAMELWSKGVCLVTIRIKNGLQLRGCVYAPQTKLFTVYGIYKFETPFFG